MLLSVRLRVIVMGFATLAFSACGGGGGASGGGVAPAPSAAAPASFTARFSFTLAQKPASRGRRPAYIAPSSRSLRVDTVYGSTASPAASINLTTTTGGVCTIAGGTETCAVSVVAQTGASQFVLTFFDQPNALGNALSTATVAVPPVTNGVANVAVTLQAIVASISLAVAGSLTPGVPGTATLALVAKDADGNVITSGPFNEPIQLISTNPSIALSAPAITDPTTPVTITYNGGTTTGTTIIAKTTTITVNFTPPFSGTAPGAIVLVGAPAGNSIVASFPLTITQAGYTGAFTISATNATVTPATANGPAATVMVSGTPGVVHLVVTGSGGQTSSIAFNLYGPIVTNTGGVAAAVGAPPVTFTAREPGAGGTVTVSSVCAPGASIALAPATFPADGSVQTISVTALSIATGTPAHACVITLGGVLETATVNVDVSQNSFTIQGPPR